MTLHDRKTIRSVYSHMLNIRSSEQKWIEMSLEDFEIPVLGK